MDKSWEGHVLSMGFICELRWPTSDFLLCSDMPFRPAWSNISHLQSLDLNGGLCQGFLRLLLPSSGWSMLRLDFFSLIFGLGCLLL